ncbi:MAG: glycosyltransferase family 2 protein [Panacagrimonas sp.]
MKFSIVTISYNQARFLEEAMRSVVEQDYTDIEYIVVDPGSTDGSREIIERYRDRIAKLIYEPDKGPADGLNKGFAAANGDILGFLNSDDILERDTLGRVARYFDRHPRVDVVSGHSWIIDEAGTVRRRSYSDRFSLRMAAYGASILSQASTFFRADAFRRTGGFNVANRWSWDGELFVDMALAGARFSLEPQFWSRFRIHDAGITGSGKSRQFLRQERDQMFRRIMRREPGGIDAVLRVAARYARKGLNWADTIERLRHGPIAGQPH